MTGERINYRQLAGRAGIFALHRAFLGDDHILAVKTVLVREAYRRFFFRDIAAFSIHRTDRFSAYTIVLGAALLLSGLILWAVWPGSAQDSPVAAVILSVIATTLAIAFVVNLARGPTCTCYIRTAVQTVELPSISRVRRAMVARAMIIERINAAQTGIEQGAADSETPSTTPVGEWRASPVALHDSAHSVPAAPAMSPSAHRRAVHSLGATAVGAIIAACGVSYDFVETSASATAVNLLGVLVAMSAAVTQLILGRSGRLSRPAMIVAWAVPCILMLGVLAGYVSLIAVIATNPELVTPGQADPFSILTTLPPGTSVVVDACHLTIAGLFAVVGLAGCVVWIAEGRSPRVATPDGSIADEKK